MTILLANDFILRAFERGIIELVKQSALQRAEHLLSEAINVFGSADLRKAIDALKGRCDIDGWDALCADMLEVDQRFRNEGGDGVALIEISLANRQKGKTLVEDLRVERKFFGSAELNVHGTPKGVGARAIDQSERIVRVTGLEELMAIQRRRPPSGDSHAPERLKWGIDNALSGLMLIVRYQHVVDHYLKERGFPLKVSVFVQMDRVSRPDEAGVNDFGPQAWRLIGESENEPQPLNAAAEILAERTAERRSKFQAEVNRMIAEYREIYRILRMFPFYRFLARNRLADQFSGQLKLACKAKGLRKWGVGWRMGKRAFEGFLKRFAEAMNPPSVEAALDPGHVDALHERWVDLARAKDFELGSSPTSLFELNLAWALKFGGPILQDRWEHTKPYRLS